MKSKSAVIIVILIILLIALITALGKIFGDPNKSSGEYFLEAFIIVLIVITCVVIGMKLIYGIDVSSYICNFLQNFSCGFVIGVKN